MSNFVDQCKIGAGQTVILSGWKTAAVRMQIQIQNSFTASVSQKKDTKNRWKRTGDRNTVVKLKNYTESSMIPSRRMNDIRVWKVWKGYWRKKTSGEILDEQEENYLKIFANLHDYERAAANGRLRNTLFPKIQEALEKAGIDVQGKEYFIEMDIYGKITVTGELSEEEKGKAADVLEEQFSDELWDCHMQASDYTTAEFNRINAYKEISDFLGKATGDSIHGMIFQWMGMGISADFLKKCASY